MKVYLGASVTVDRSHLPLYQKLAEEIEELGHEVVSQDVIDPATKPPTDVSAEELFEREVARLKKADVMVAEVTVPSWGTAFLMEQALEQHKPVLALFYRDNHYPLSMMVEGHPDFYLDHYDEDNLEAVVKRNFDHFQHMRKDTGKLVVIDGADGAGKATQTKLLLEYLKEKRIKSKFISFPRYHTSFHGHHVARFLKGEFGGNNDVSPYLSSLAFALDRLTAREELLQWLKAGNLVVADRYTSANMAHQTSKLPEDKQEDFFNWLYDMEYKEHKLPREDLVLFLHVPAEISQKLLDKKSTSKNNAGEKDEAEKDLEHQKKSIAMYKKLVARFEHWLLIECIENGELLSREVIHQKIIATLKERGIIE